MPVIQGSEIGTETAGLFSPLLDQTMPLSEKFLLVESSKRYVTAPATGFQANDGVREKVCTTGSFARSVKACRPCGPRLAARADPAGAATASAATNAAVRRAQTISEKLSAPALRAQSLVRVTSTE